MIDYRKINGIISSDENPLVMVQLDSFHRVHKKYDIVILDESESIFEQFSSAKIDKLNFIMKHFEYIVKSAKRVICMDAYMTERTIEIIKKIRHENDPDKSNISFVVNRYKNQGVKSGQYTYNIGNDVNYFIEDIYKSLDNKKKIVIISNGRDELKSYEKLITEKYPKLNIQSYTALSDKDDREELEDVNKSWIQYDVIMYSPTITAGISFEQSHFDKVYCIFSNTSCSVLSCIQMIGRIREVVDKEITIVLNTKHFNCSITKEGIEEDFINGRNELFTLSYKGNTELDIDDDRQYFKYIPNKDNYWYIWLYNQLAINISKKFFMKYLMYCIHITGAKIIIFDKINGNNNKIKKEALKLVKQDRIQCIANSDLPSDEEYHRICEKGQNTSISMIEQSKLDKVFIRKVYNITNDHLLFNTEFIEKYYPIRVREIYRNLSTILRYNTMEAGCKDIAKAEFDDYYRHCKNNDSKSYLNTSEISLKHQFCLYLINICGFNHILDKKNINEKNFIERLNERNTPFINLKKKIGKFDDKSINLKLVKDNTKTKEERLFNAKLKGINDALIRFYGIKIKNGKEKYCIKHKHGFKIVENDLDTLFLYDTSPIIWYSKYKKRKDIEIKKYRHPEDPIGISQNNSEDDLNKIEYKVNIDSDEDDND